MALSSVPATTYLKLNQGLNQAVVLGAVPFDYTLSQKNTHQTNMKAQMNTNYLTRMRLAGK